VCCPPTSKLRGGHEGHREPRHPSVCTLGPGICTVHTVHRVPGALAQAL
jgi:hypothetical protein